jgi:hypothetical protein
MTEMTFNKNIVIVGTEDISSFINNYNFASNITYNKDSQFDYNNIDAVINISNNFKLSRELNNDCVNYGIAFADISIDKSSIKTHVIIPHITDPTVIEPLYKEKTFLACVVNNFPKEPEHIIAWAKENVTQLHCIINPIQYAYNLFLELYFININKLINVTEEDTWKNKLKPITITFDYTDEEHLEFVYNTVYLFDTNYTHKYIKEQVKLIALCDRKAHVTPETLLNENTNTDYTKYIEWIKSAVNIRCNNYGIDKPTTNTIRYECNLHQIPIESIHKGVEIVINELVKYFKGETNFVNKFVDTFDNIIIDTPIKPITIININGINFDSWDKLTYNITNKTLDEMKKYYEGKFNITLSMIVEGSRILYADYICTENLDKQLSSLIEKDMIITLMCTTDIEIPDIKVTL